MSSDVASLPREPDILIEMIAELARRERQTAGDAGDAEADPVWRALGEARCGCRATAARARGSLDGPGRTGAGGRRQAETGRISRRARSACATSAVFPSICRAKMSSSSRRSMLARAARARCIASARTSARCSTSCRRSSGSNASSRPRYGCRACESAVVQAPAPPRPVEGGLPTAALLAHVAVSKFAWHLPLHRQTQMLAGHGIDLDRSTLVHWIERAAWWLKPLHTLLVETVMAATKIFCDDTPLPVLDHTRRRTRIGRFWCYAVDDRPWQGPDAAGGGLSLRRRPPRPPYREIISAGSTACCRSMAIPDMTTWPSRTVPPARSRSPTVWRMRDGSSSTCTNGRRTQSPRKRCAGSARSMPSRRASAAAAAEERVAVRQAETKPLMAALWSWLMERSARSRRSHRWRVAIRYYARPLGRAHTVPLRRPDRGRQQHGRARHPADSVGKKEYSVCWQ